MREMAVLNDMKIVGRSEKTTSSCAGEMHRPDHLHVLDAQA